MDPLIYFNPVSVTQSSDRHYAGMERFASFFKIFRSASAPIDRTGVITLPIRTTSLFPIPAFRPFTISYETLCNDRAVELLGRAEALGCPLYAFWSGGIDSTLVLVSLLKNATPAQREQIVVLLSEESISENPLFYRDHIRGKLRRESSVLFPQLLGKEYLFVNGELNDQLFGAELTRSFMMRFGAPSIHKAFDKQSFADFFKEKTGDTDVGTFYAEMFERLGRAAPIRLSSNHDFIWWFNFAAHWQSVYLRTISYVAERNRNLVTQKYLDTYYAPFYNTDDFQLWSMNNPDKRIKDTWESYKWPCKDIIFEYTKDAAYRDTKTKRGSLFALLYHQNPFNFIDTSLRFSHDIDLAKYFVAENDFV